MSESTPGPIGVNMATYAGFLTAGIPGCAVSTLGLITPSVLVILLIARFLQRFRHSRGVNAVLVVLEGGDTALAHDIAEIRSAFDDLAARTGAQARSINQLLEQQAGLAQEISRATRELGAAGSVVA